MGQYVKDKKNFFYDNDETQIGTYILIQVSIEPSCLRTQPTFNLNSSWVGVFLVAFISCNRVPVETGCPTTLQHSWIDVLLVQAQSADK